MWNALIDEMRKFGLEDDIDFLQEENDIMTMVEIRKLAAESSRPFSEWLQDFKSLLTAGYTEDEALKILREKE